MQSTLQTAGCELAVMLSLFEKIQYIDVARNDMCNAIAYDQKLQAGKEEHSR